LSQNMRTAEMNTLDALDADSLRDDIPEFRPGDTVKVHVRVVEGNRSRIQVFQGVVIRRQGGGIRETLPVRKARLGVAVAGAGPDRDDALARSAATGRADGRAGRKKAAKKGSLLRELPVLLIIAFVLALVVKTFFVQAFFIPSGSMEQTLHGCTGCTGDRVLVNKVPYWFGEPDPGDIVVFKGPDTWTPEVSVSRPGNWFTGGL